MEALYDCDELDEYIDEHAAEFVSYEAGSEQQLGWTAVHMQYVALVEAQIEEHLGELGIGSEGLYALLSEAAGGDSRADTFLERLLGMGDHEHFCAAMRDGDGRNPNPNPALTLTPALTDLTLTLSLGLTLTMTLTLSLSLTPTLTLTLTITLTLTLTLTLALTLSP